jgi:hypothetical protein
MPVALPRIYPASCIAQGVRRTRVFHKKVRLINILIPFLWRATMARELTILHCEDAAAHPREVSDLSAKIMTTAVARCGAQAPTRVNLA